MKGTAMASKAPATVRCHKPVEGPSKHGERERYEKQKLQHILTTFRLLEAFGPLLLPSVID
eukprot:scaffold815_cov363-Pavlova_lutheri.AAC.2